MILIVMPETCRNVVGNGSVPPQKWNYSLMSFLRLRRQRKAGIPIATGMLSNKRRPSLLASLQIVRYKQALLLLLFNSLQSAGYFILLASLPQQLESTFHYNSIQVGLYYIPIGCGILISRQIIGRLLDRNFRRHVKKLSITIVKNR
jgi:predicted MFS family arabinose efflux permease